MPAKSKKGDAYLVLVHRALKH